MLVSAGPFTSGARSLRSSYCLLRQTLSALDVQVHCMLMEALIARDLLATVMSASLACILVKTLEFSASHGYLTQVGYWQLVYFSNVTHNL